MMIAYRYVLFSVHIINARYLNGFGDLPLEAFPSDRDIRIERQQWLGAWQIWLDI